MSEEKKEKEKSAEPTEAPILRTAGTATGSNYLLL